MFYRAATVTLSPAKKHIVVLAQMVAISKSKFVTFKSYRTTGFIVEPQKL